MVATAVGAAAAVEVRVAQAAAPAELLVIAAVVLLRAVALGMVTVVGAKGRG